jgi:hypothetical protein
MNAMDLKPGMRFYHKNENSDIIQIDRLTEKMVYIKGNGKWGINRLLDYINTELYILIN